MTDTSQQLSIGYAIGKTNWYLKTLINKLLREGGFTITTEQWLVLKIIFANPGLSQTEIAEKSLKDKTNITRILDLLEKNAYIERRSDDRDRRMYRITITHEGRKILKAVNPVTQTIDAISTRALNGREAEALIKTLDVICNSVREKL